ncbi:MAG: T9SS type A sorting domain-containing protein [Bacteroidota bacterium]
MKTLKNYFLSSVLLLVGVFNLSYAQDGSVEVTANGGRVNIFGTSVTNTSRTFADAGICALSTLDFTFQAFITITESELVSIIGTDTTALTDNDPASSVVGISYTVPDTNQEIKLEGEVTNGTTTRSFIIIINPLQEESQPLAGLNVTTTPTACIAATGGIEISYNNSDSTVIFNLINSQGIVVATTDSNNGSASFSDLGQGDYTLSYRVGSTCPTTFPNTISISLIVPDVSKFTPSVTDSECDQNNGSITVAIDSAGAYEFLLSPGGDNINADINDSEVIFGNLSPNNYTIAVFDASGCQTSLGMFNVNEVFPALNFSNPSLEGPGCTAQNGSITLDFTRDANSQIDLDNITFRLKQGNSTLATENITAQQNSVAFDGLAAGTYQVEFEVGGCTANYQDNSQSTDIELVVDNNRGVVLSPISDRSTCQGSNLTLVVFASNNESNNNNFSFSVQKNGSEVASSPTTTINIPSSALSNGNNTFSIVAVDDNNPEDALGCNMQSFNVSVTPQASVSIESSSNNVNIVEGIVEICAGVALDFEANVTGQTTCTPVWDLENINNPGSNLSSFFNANNNDVSINQNLPVGTYSLSYEADCSSLSGCSNDRTTIRIEVVEQPTISITATDGTSICTSGSVPFSASKSGGISACSADNNINWRIGDSSSGSVGENFTFDQSNSTGTFQISAVFECNVNGTGCNNASSNIINVKVVDQPSVSLEIDDSGASNNGTNITFCKVENPNITLRATVLVDTDLDDGSFSWVRNDNISLPVTTNPLVIGQNAVVPLETATYAVSYTVPQVSSNSGCSSPTSNTVTVNPIDQAEILEMEAVQSSYCEGSMVAFSYLLNVDCPGFEARIEDATGSVVQTINGTNFDGSNRMISFSQDDLPAGNYTLIIDASNCENITGCSTPADQSIPFIINPTPVGTIETTTPNVCEGGDVALNVSIDNINNYSYSWNGDPQTVFSPSNQASNVTASIQENTDFTVVIEDNATGCLTTLERTLNVVSNPNVQIVGGSNGTVVVCVGSNLALGSNVTLGAPEYLYTWKNDNDIIQTGSESSLSGFTLNQIGTSNITLEVVDENGCFGSASIIAEALDGPTASLTASNDLVCFDENQLTLIADIATGGATGRAQIRWFRDGQQVQISQADITATRDTFTYSITSAITQPTDFDFEVTFLDVTSGCNQATATENVDLRPTPRLELTTVFDNSMACQGGQSLFVANDPSGNTSIDDWSWTINGGGNITNSGNNLATVNWTNPGTYTLSVTARIGTCEGTASEEITVSNNSSGLSNAPIVFVEPNGNLLFYNDSTACGYQWGVFDNNTLMVEVLENETYQAYLSNDLDIINNTYFVNVSSCSGGCTSTISEITILEEEEVVEEKFVLYPNPNSGAFRFEATQLPGAEYNLQITDLLGRNIFNLNLEAADGQINVPIELDDQVTSGVYYLFLINEAGIYRTAPFILQR